jgi:hypothetical protein
MTKLSTPYITFPKQSDEDIEFSSLGQTPGIANNNVFYPLLLHTPAHMQLSLLNAICSLKTHSIKDLL